MDSITTVVRSPADLTTEWLSQALGGAPVESFDVAQIGTGQMSDSYRVSLTYAGPSLDAPDSVILKVAVIR